MHIDEKIEALKTASEYILRLEDGIQVCANYFQKCEESKGYNMITPIAEGIDFVNEILILTREVQKEAIDFTDINTVFKEVIKSLEREDYILMGDLFQYEIKPLLQKLNKQIQSNFI